MRKVAWRFPLALTLPLYGVYRYTGCNLSSLFIPHLASSLSCWIWSSIHKWVNFFSFIGHLEKLIRFFQRSFLNDTHREKAPSNKTPAFTKSTNMGICVVGTTNQLFIRGS